MQRLPAPRPNAWMRCWPWRSSPAQLVNVYDGSGIGSCGRGASRRRARPGIRNASSDGDRECAGDRSPSMASRARPTTRSRSALTGSPSPRTSSNRLDGTSSCRWRRRERPLVPRRRLGPRPRVLAAVVGLLRSGVLAGPDLMIDVEVVARLADEPLVQPADVVAADRTWPASWSAMKSTILRHQSRSRFGTRVGFGPARDVDDVGRVTWPRGYGTTPDDALAERRIDWRVSDRRVSVHALGRASPRNHSYWIVPQAFAPPRPMLSASSPTCRRDHRNSGPSHPAPWPSRTGSATYVAPAGGWRSGPSVEPSGLWTATSSRRPLSSNPADSGSQPAASPIGVGVIADVDRSRAARPSPPMYPPAARS